MSVGGSDKVKGEKSGHASEGEEKGSCPVFVAIYLGTAPESLLKAALFQEPKKGVEVGSG